MTYHEYLVGCSSSAHYQKVCSFLGPLRCLERFKIRTRKIYYICCLSERLGIEISTVSFLVEFVVPAYAMSLLASARRHLSRTIPQILPTSGLAATAISLPQLFTKRYLVHGLIA